MSNVLRPPNLDDTRVLLVCPHPDDETLAAGLLLQHALARGAAVRVIFVTDGDNNAIPQFLAERSVDRRRWARRRRWEARRALRTLGVKQSDVEFWGFPDQGVSGVMLEVTQRLDAVMEAFQPTLVIAPSIHDLHDDHVAVGLSAFAASDGRSVDLFTYVVHGAVPRGEVFVPEFDSTAVHRKFAALHCHTSQLIASRRRMETICARPEVFRHFGSDAAVAPVRFRRLRRFLRLFEGMAGHRLAAHAVLPRTKPIDGREDDRGYSTVTLFAKLRG